MTERAPRRNKPERAPNNVTEPSAKELQVGYAYALDNYATPLDLDRMSRLFKDLSERYIDPANKGVSYKALAMRVVNQGNVRFDQRAAYTGAILAIGNYRSTHPAEPKISDLPQSVGNVKTVQEVKARETREFWERRKNEREQVDDRRDIYNPETGDMEPNESFGQNVDN